MRTGVVQKPQFPTRRHKLTPHSVDQKVYSPDVKETPAVAGGGDKLNGETQWQETWGQPWFEALKDHTWGKYSPPWKSLTWCYKDVFRRFFPSKNML